jgi:hypothetical protein
MNYYAQGGQAHGLKALAQELPQYGRHGDSIVAHINPQEAGILKALGGSGTINPHTGLPEFLKIGNPFKPVQQAVAAINPFNPGSSLSKTINTTPIVGDINKALNNAGTQVFQPLEKAIVQPVSRGLASFDKAVGNTIPGGWGTVGSVALAAMGAPVPLQVGYGAARGSGVMRKGGNFNLQGAMIGGASAYAMSELGDYMRGAAPEAALLPESVPVTDYSAPLVDGVNVPYAPVPSPEVGYDYASGLSEMPGNAAQPYTPPSFLDKAATKFYDATGSTAKFITEAPTTGVSTAARTGQGGLNLLGIGEGTAKEAAALAAKTGVKALPMTAMALYGETTMADLDAQRDLLKQQQAAGNIAQAEYDKALAEINRQRDYAADVVSKNPFSTDPSRDASMDPTYYGRSGEIDNLYSRMKGEDRLYAVGGSVDDEYGMDEARGLNQGNLQNGLFGGGITGYAAGGQTRFLSGGGDGMSDDIPATINGNQEARLADGEFVVSSDVVSGLGNGSSKAGAKQLYSMMDRVRSARTGRKKQAPAVNPRKLMPA